MNDEILTSDYGRDNDYDKSLRPKLLDEFIGQKHFIDNLKVYIKAAKKRNEPLDHIILSGPPGLGKTTLASIIAREMNVNFKSTSAPMLDKTGDLAAILTDIEQGDILFIDEIHRLKSTIEEVLYTAMEDYSLDLMIGQGPSAKSVKISLCPFTLIGATTRTGLLSSPLLTRFGISGKLDFYSQNEIKQIITRSAELLGVKIENDAADLLSRCSRGTPRVANNILKRIRDFAQIEGKGIINYSIAENSLDRMKIDSMGLNKIDLHILNILIDHYDGGPVGCKTIAVSIGEEPETIEEVYEPFLIQLGFIKRTPRGRIATKKAYLHLGLKYHGKHDKSLFD
jgi:Holliday junction DNA helicase RuvB